MASNLVSVWVISMVLIGATMESEGEITCTQVDDSLKPCISYLQSKTGRAVPPPQCCGGIESLNNAAKTTPDRQATCRCIQTAAASIPGINSELVAGLPRKCGVIIPYTFSPKTDCSKVQ